MDAHLILINKPSGLLSQPGKTNPDSVHTRLQQELGDVRLIHRLDMSTSGLMVFARSRLAEKSLARQFQDRQISKSYQALVLGQLPAPQGSINLPLLCDWPNRPKQHVCPDGRPSTTHWQCLSQIKEQDEYISRVQLTPITGRSHQLRVHMLSLGYPILGDEFYANKKALAMRPRLCLHAQAIGFYHPITQHRLHFTASPDF